MTGDPLTVQGSATRPLLVGDTKCDAPAIIVDNLTEDGMIGLDSNHCTIDATGSLPRNEKQVLYYKKCSASKGDSTKDILYNVILQCKSSNSFVWSVVAAPQPMAVLCTDQQQDDMVRFLTNTLNYVIMGVDLAFNFGDIYVTPIVYQHLLLEHRLRKNHPIMLGAILVHHDKKFSSYHYFASTLISLKPSLRNIIAFGTDGEEELFEAFQTQLPNTLHLRCFCHFRSNIKRKLLDLFII